MHHMLLVAIATLFMATSWPSPARAEGPTIFQLGLPEYQIQCIVWSLHNASTSYLRARVVSKAVGDQMLTSTGFQGPENYLPYDVLVSKRQLEFTLVFSMLVDLCEIRGVIAAE